MRLDLLEDKIRATANELFVLDKNVSRYMSLKYRLERDLYKYACQKYYHYDPDDFQSESTIEVNTEAIFVTILSCMKSFEPEKGDFIHYFNYSCARKTTRMDGLEKNKDIPKKIFYSIRAFIRAEASIGCSVSEDDVYAFAERNNIKKEFVDLYYKKTRSIDAGAGDDNESTVLDYIENKNASDPLQLSCEEEHINDIIDSIEHTFLNSQERQREMLSLMLTSRFLDQYGTSGSVIKYVKQKSFFNEDAYRFYLKNSRPYKDEEIAELLGRRADVISRTFSKYRDKWKSR